MTHYFQTMSKTRRYSVSCYTSKTQAGHLTTARKLWSLLHECDIWLIIFFIYFFLTQRWLICTDQLSSTFSREDSLKQVHAQLSMVRYVMRVLRQSKQETLMVICSPATQPETEPNTKNMGSMKMTKYNEVSPFCSFHFYKPKWLTANKSKKLIKWKWIWGYTVSMYCWYLAELLF